MAALRWFSKLRTHPIINIHTATYGTISKDLRDLKLNTVVNLFESFGFSQAHVDRILLVRPTRLLSPRLLKPKLQFLQSIFNQSDSDVVKIVNKTPHVLKRSLKNHLVPIFDLLKSITGSHQNAAASIMSNPFVLTYSISTDLLRNIELLQRIGVPEDQVLKFITGYGQVSGKKHDKFCKVVEKVRDMGFDVSSYSFRRAVNTMCLISDETWEAKCKVYRSFGFSDDEIVLMFKKLPAVVAYSEKRIRQVVGFYVEKLGWPQSRLAVMPYVTAFSLEKRIVPRCSVLQALESRKSITSKLGLYQILVMADSAFLEKYVIAHIVEVPDVMDAYTGKLRFDEYNFRCRF
ncbi:hypothetical protein ACET3Z_007847 [Daucus carota]